MPIDAAEIQRGLEWLIDNEAGTAFERLAVGLAMQERPDLIPTTTKSDLGADAISPSVLSSVHADPRVAVAASLTATAQKINADAENINKNYGQIDVLYFFTARPITQKKIKEIAKKIKQDWGHDLIVHPKESLMQRLLASQSASLCESFLRISIPDPGLDDLERSIREAMQNQLANRFQYFENGDLLIELTLHTDRGWPCTHEQITDLLEHGAAITIRGDPGGGKTTTLLQIATRMIERDGGRVPIYIDLPSWFLQGGDLVGHLGRRQEFLAADLSEAKIARFLASGRCALFLNGWNEIQGTRRETAHQALLAIRRDFPATALVLASRPADDLPNVSSAVYDLQGITHQQRNQYLRRRFGDTATRLIDMLERDVGLSRMTRNPLILDAVATSFESDGTLPRTRTDAIRASLSILEQSTDHAPALQHGAVQGQETEFLAVIAAVMTDRSTVIIPSQTAINQVRFVGERLAAEGAIRNAPDPGEVLDCLVSHHVLQYPDDGHGYTFSHQVYQEYYAAERLRLRIDSIFDSDTINQKELLEFVATILNRPDWLTALLSVVEFFQSKVLQGDKSFISKLQALIICSSLIDPVFSASLIRLTDDSSWEAVRIPWLGMLDTWTNLPPPYDFISLIAKIECGRPDFQNEVWKALEANQNVRETVARAPSGLSPVSLGPEWQGKVQAWPEDRRRDLLAMFGYHGASGESIEAVMWFAGDDPSEAIRVQATEHLLWNGAWQRASTIVLQAEQADIIRLLQSGLLRENWLNTDAIQRIRRLALSELEVGRDSLDQLKLARHVHEDLQLDVLDRVKQVLGIEGFSFCGEGSDRWRNHDLEQWAIRYILKEDSMWAREWILEAFTEGHLVGQLEDYLQEASPEEMALILEAAMTEATINQGRSSQLFEALAALANAEVVAVALSRRQEADEIHDLEYSLRQFLRNVAPATLVSAIVEEFPTLSIEDVHALRSFLGTSAAQEDRKYERTPDCEILLERWRTILPEVIESDDFSGQLLADYANVLSCIGVDADILTIRRLIEKDILRWQEERRLLLEWRERGGGPQPNVSRMSQTAWLVGALLRLSPDASKDILLELLDQRDYERDAQRALIWSAIRPFQDIEIGGFWAPSAWVRAYRARNGRDDRLVRVEAEVAALLRPRLVQLYEAIDLDNVEAIEIGRLKGLCESFAGVASQGDCEMILEVMSWPRDFDSFSRVRTLESLYSRGLLLSHVWIERVFSVLWEKIRTRHWLEQGEEHNFVCSMQALAFSDNPELAVPIWRAFGEHLRGNDRGDLVMAIIASGFEGCLEIAYDLDCDHSTDKRSRAWIEGILRYADPERAAPFLIDVALGENWRALEMGISYHQRDGFIQILSARIEDDEESRSSLVEAAQREPQRRNWIAFLLGSAGENGLKAALRLLDDGTEEPVPGGLREAIRERWLVDRIPYRGGSIIGVRPRAANTLRSNLLSIVLGDATKQKAALALLGEIYCVRLEHGEALGEDRHPDLNQNCCWPLADWRLDDALARVIADLAN